MFWKHLSGPSNIVEYVMGNDGSLIIQKLVSIKILGLLERNLGTLNQTDRHKT